jgi:hypothetical protein
MNNKNFVLVTDLRAMPVCAAITLARTRHAKLIFSSEILGSSDYGQSNNRLLRATIVFLLKLLFRAREIESSNSEIVELDETGIISSLISITNDSLATKDKYPVIWRGLYKLHMGAIDLVDYCKGIGADNLFVFNGRLASSYEFTSYGKSEGVNIYFYEYGSSFDKFLLIDFLVHDLTEWGKRQLDFYNNGVISNSHLWLEAEKFKKQKLSNIYNVTEPCSKKYDVAVFLSSAHEYKSLCESIPSFEARSEVELVKAAYQDFGEGKTMCVRCHPNNINDPSFKKVLGPLEDLCAELKIDYYGTDSKISTHSILINSDLAVVDISSVFVDAMILGVEAHMYGKNHISVIVEGLSKNYESDLLTDEVAKVLSLRTVLYQERLITIGVLINGIASLWNYIVRKLG